MSVIDLIARLEAASAPSRDLDHEIVVDGLGWRRAQAGSAAWPHFVWRTPDGAQFPADDKALPRYTESIDAALTLIPDLAKFCWTIEPDAAWVRWMGKKDVEEAQGYFLRREGRCTAMAICIAALKARHNSLTEG